jgi:hypothetical protein
LGRAMYDDGIHRYRTVFSCGAQEIKKNLRHQKNIYYICI